VSFVAWMLAFHLLAAFAVAAALVLFSVLVYSGRRMTTLAETRLLFRLAPVGTILVTAWLGLVLVFGVILSLDTDGLHIWDGWIVAGIVLWAAAGGIGQRTGAYYTAIEKLAEAPDASESDVLARLKAPTGALLHAATVGLFVLILLDMIFKPGA
jgi:drug/metabolite transporter (DMT)-like permease